MGLRAGEVDVAYRIRGSGPGLLLIAGTGYPGATWPESMVDALASAYTVITYDHRGTGATNGTPGTYTTRLFARDAARLLDRLDLGPVHVLGHSMGGRVAQWLALDAPRHVRTLILAASGAGPAPGATGHVRGIPAAVAAAMVELGYDGFIRRLQRDTFFTDGFAESRPDALDQLVLAFWRHRPSPLDYFKHVEARQGHDTHEELASLHVPALVLVGTLETRHGGTGSHVDQAHVLARSLPDATLIELENVKHGFFWERPDESVRTVAEWLATQS